MTREEREQAIAILENEKKCVNRANKNDYCNRDCYNCELVKTDTEILTALDMAIKALQEQADNIPVMYYPQVDGITPTVVAQADGDLVSRLSVIGKIEAEAWSYCEGLDANKQIYISEAINNIREAVKQLPSVDIPPAEPREVLYSGDGYADGEMVYDMAECMNCGREFEYDDETWGCNFCPDCGQALKWEGEQE